MNLVGLALRNLKRRPIRTCLSILGIGLAVGSALALIALSRSIQDSTREGMDEIGDDLVVMQKGSSDIFGGFIPEETVDRIAALPGIVRVSGELVTFAPSGFANNVLTLGWPDASYLWKKVPLREGRVPAAGERRVAVLGDTAAASLGKKLDDDLELIGQTFRVVGIAAYTTTVNRGLVLVPLIDLQEASYRPRQVTIVHVNVEHASGRAELGSVRVAIEALGRLLSLLAAFAFPRIPAIGNLISFKPSVALIAPVVVAAFVLCVLGALLPAWRAVRMVPAEALRRL
jgi:putative ABC transport system permease protein